MSKAKKAKQLLVNHNVVEIKPVVGAPFESVKAKIVELLPDRKEYEVSFDLMGVNDSVANAIRRTAIDELEIKALTFDKTTVQTNVDFLLVSELLDRIEYIPIRQEIRDDANLSLMVVNSGEEDITVYSNIAGGGGNIPSKIRLAELKPGNYLKIPKISVIKGYGKHHSRFSLTSDYCYINLDYMDVAFINNRGNRIKKRVKTSDVVALIGKVPTGSKILVIPNAKYSSLISEIEQRRIDGAKYDYVLKNSGVPATDDEYLMERSSSLYSSTDFRMKFYLSDQIDPNGFVKLVCSNIIGRLTKVLEALKAVNKNVIDIKVSPVNVKHGDETAVAELYELVIYGETHTVGELIVKHIFMLNPDIGFVKKFMIHPRDEKVSIQIIHPNANKLCIDALEACIETFGVISGQV